jgi:hypothetical protein
VGFAVVCGLVWVSAAIAIISEKLGTKLDASFLERPQRPSGNVIESSKATDQTGRASVIRLLFVRKLLPVARTCRYTTRPPLTRLFSTGSSSGAPPTLMIFKGGELASRQVGAAPKQKPHQWISGAV